MEAPQVFWFRIYSPTAAEFLEQTVHLYLKKQNKHIFELASRVCSCQFDQNRAAQRPPGPAGFWLWPGPLGLASGLLPACSPAESCCLAPSPFHLLSIHFSQQLVKLIHNYDFCVFVCLHICARNLKKTCNGILLCGFAAPLRWHGVTASLFQCGEFTDMFFHSLKT